MARELSVRGKAWQSVSLLVLGEATEEATMAPRAKTPDSPLPRPQLPFGWVAPLARLGIDGDAFGFDFVVAREWEAAHASPTTGSSQPHRARADLVVDGRPAEVASLCSYRRSYGLQRRSGSCSAMRPKSASVVRSCNS